MFSGCPFMQMVTQMLKSLMASADEVDEEKLDEPELELEMDKESKDFLRNAAEINAIVDQERESLNQLAQATGKNSEISLN